ncbi:Arm DNA-binding domain-containing protein [Thermaurantiacus sp.]
MFATFSYGVVFPAPSPAVVRRCAPASALVHGISRGIGRAIHGFLWPCITDARIRAARPRERPYRLGDSGQLDLHVTPAGGKLWRMNSSFGRNAKGKPLQ